MTIEKQIIGVQFSGLGNETFYSYNPSTDDNNDYLFCKSTSQEISLAFEKAAIAFKHYKAKSGIDKADFLKNYSGRNVNIGEDLILVCMAETALPAARIEGEKGRTINQQMWKYVTMVHGGPYPATTDCRTTSVGTAAIYRFVKPACCQNMPQSLLPEELIDLNPMKITG